MPLSIYKRGDIWHYRGTVAGRRVRGSCGTADRKTAERVKTERETQEWKRRHDGPEAVLTFSMAAQLYRQAGKPTRFLEPIEDYWKDTLVKDISSGAVRTSALKILPACGGATRNRNVIVPTQAIINHAAENDLCPRMKVKRFPVVRKEKEPADWNWVRAFMDACEAGGRYNLGALACFMFLTGARITEALSIQWTDVNLAKRRAKIRQTKIGAERWAHLPQELVVALGNIGGDREGSVFGYSSRSTAKIQWMKYVGKAGIKKLSFHSCRHGFATAMLQAGVDPVTTAKRGGWKSPAHLFATYGHAMDDETVTDRIIGTSVTQKAGISEEKKDASNG